MCFPENENPEGNKHLSDYLVGGFKASEKYESIGMIIPNIWENKSHVPNHHPDLYTKEQFTLRVDVQVWNLDSIK